MRLWIGSTALAALVALSAAGQDRVPPPPPEFPEPIEVPLPGQTPPAPPALGAAAGAAALAVPGPKAITVELTTTGYKMYLNRATAELLQEALKGVTDEKALAERIRTRIKPDTSAESKAKMELLAFAVQKQLPQFREQLGTRMGDNGVIVTVHGPQKKPKRERPVLKAIAKLALNDELEEKAQKLLTVMRTQAVWWSVAPW